MMVLLLMVMTALAIHGAVMYHEELAITSQEHYAALFAYETSCNEPGLRVSHGRFLDCDGALRVIHTRSLELKTIDRVIVRMVDGLRLAAFHDTLRVVLIFCVILCMFVAWRLVGLRLPCTKTKHEDQSCQNIATVIDCDGQRMDERDYASKRRPVPLHGRHY